MGGVSRFILLLSTPLSLLQPRPSFFRLAGHSRISLASLSCAPHHLALCPVSRPQSLLPIKVSQQFHTQTNSKVKESHSGDSLAPAPHPWPEWSQLVGTLSAGGYFDRHRFDEVEGNIIGTEDAFVTYENLLEEFVRAASACLGFARERPDILGLLSRRDIEVLVENGTPFLFTSAVDTERRMRSFLGSSGSSLKVVESDKAQTVDLMKYILSYASNPTISSERNNFYSVTESSFRCLLRELADVICRVPVSDMSTPEQYHVSDRYGQTPRVLGANIAMKRGDWICAKCNFMNFARNTKCLECEELRPKRQLTGGEWDCPQCDFFNFGRNLVCLRCDCKRPDEASLSSVNSRSGSGYVNGDYANRAAVDSRLVANEEKARRQFSKVSPVNPASDLCNAGRLANCQYQTNLGSDDTSEGTHKTLDTSISCSLDQILGRTSTVSGTNNKSDNAGQDTQNPKGSNSSYVPFMPLPADMFAQKSQKSTIENSEEAVTKSSTLFSSKAHDRTGTVTVSNDSTQAERQIKEREEKSERWFKKVAELHDVTDLASAISDEDFPEIMPVRKGENRFVVSKKKDRSLTSPAYKRQKAMEQGSNTNFVPFVPFPPDYFARKDKQQPETTELTEKPMDGSSSNHSSHENSNGTTVPGMTDKDHMQGTEIQQTSAEKLNVRSETRESSAQPPENQTVRSGWTGKSLEGSAVKEPDPLDMSEEAKAERWFRRVAQIKDISELSDIPDEDFPSIMPMRKGVNRFVVSKRKTPLERRLTSPQYRKNLRTVSTDPVKKENGSS